MAYDRIIADPTMNVQNILNAPLKLCNDPCSCAILKSSLLVRHVTLGNKIILKSFLG
jgi:hypothetical protein